MRGLRDGGDRRFKIIRDSLKMNFFYWTVQGTDIAINDDKYVLGYRVVHYCEGIHVSVVMREGY